MKIKATSAIQGRNRVNIFCAFLLLSHCSTDFQHPLSFCVTCFFFVASYHETRFLLHPKTTDHFPLSLRCRALLLFRFVNASLLFVVVVVFFLASSLHCFVANVIMSKNVEEKFMFYACHTDQNGFLVAAEQEMPSI